MVGDNDSGGMPGAHDGERETGETAGAGYSELLARVPAIVYVADAGETGSWSYVSPQIEQILGYTPAEWCADPELWLARLHPDDRQWVVAREESLIGADPDSPALEYRMIHRDGRVVWIRDDAVLTHDENGELRWHGVLSDVTERKQFEAELERRAAQQAAVALLGEHALEGASTVDLMHEAVSSASQMLGVELAAVWELQPDENALVLQAGIGWTESEFGTLRYPAGEGSQAGYTLLTGAPVIVEDWDTETRFAQPRYGERRTGAGLSVKIEGRSREAFGVLVVQSMAPRSFAPGDIDFLQALANVLADAIERQAIEDSIREQAVHDPLTGLPNRVLFVDRLEHALARLGRAESLCAILFLDLDHFKLVNDSLGHHVGDELLTAAAPRLRQALRSSDTVARFGGDEFGVLLEDIASERDAIETAERIAAIFARPFVLSGSEHFVTTSIGIALARGGERADELTRDADAAMYRAKDRGRARYEVFDEGMRGRAIERLRVENDLRRAIERGELRLEYQPVVSLRNFSIVGVEALLRWRHPQRGEVPPSEFIPIAEENGLIEPIGRWVLEHACRQAAQWYKGRPDAAPLTMSVNLSAVQVRRSLPDVVKSVLRSTGLDPACLSLEITETVMVRDAEGLGEVLQALKALGVRLVLDDFGTGYSSLSYLTRLPLDVLKVDRSFVDGLGSESRDTAITETIIAMSRALSLDVVAEGVETPDHVRELSRLGCGLAQGFHFSRAVPAEEITRALEHGPRWLAAREA
ncbi:MAG TPA: EAL domain-containing protein [Solirubrobacteraceae bacterium]|nr:EAL domain-containing protein [Solirubrobacteraceae bacterium]